MKRFGKRVMLSAVALVMLVGAGAVLAGFAGPNAQARNVDGDSGYRVCWRQDGIVCERDGENCQRNGERCGLGNGNCGQNGQGNGRRNGR